MTRPVRLGVLTPSSNTALEPLTSAIVAGVPGCSAHFSRFKVTEIALSDQALGQFDDSKILAAAELLADAQGRRDRLERHLVRLARLRRRPAPGRAHPRAHRHPGHTAVLALNELLALRGVTRLAWSRPIPPTCSSASSTTTARSASRWSPSATWASASTTISRGVEPQALLRADARGGDGAAAGHHHLLHQPARRAAGASGSSANSASPCSTPSAPPSGACCARPACRPGATCAAGGRCSNGTDPGTTRRAR